METFVTVSMLLVERDAIARAAAAAGVSEADYLLQSALAAAKAKAAKAMTDDERRQQQALIAAYTDAMEYTPDRVEMGRVAKKAKELAKAGRNPGELSSVVAWMRENDSRYKRGAHIPIEEVAKQWPAWQVQQRKGQGTAQSPAPQTIAQPLMRGMLEDVVTDIEF